MIIKARDIYASVAKKHNLDPKFVQIVGESVFNALRGKLEHPTDLAYELPKLGTFILRHKKFKISVDRTRQAANNGLDNAMNAGAKAILVHWEVILEKIREFKEIKTAKRKLRYEPKEEAK